MCVAAGSNAYEQDIKQIITSSTDQNQSKGASPKDRSDWEAFVRSASFPDVG